MHVYTGKLCIYSNTISIATATISFTPVFCAATNQGWLLLRMYNYVHVFDMYIIMYIALATVTN